MYVLIVYISWPSASLCYCVSQCYRQAWYATFQHLLLLLIRTRVSSSKTQFSWQTILYVAVLWILDMDFFLGGLLFWKPRPVYNGACFYLGGKNWGTKNLVWKRFVSVWLKTKYRLRKFSFAGSSDALRSMIDSHVLMNKRNSFCVVIYDLHEKLRVLVRNAWIMGQVAASCRSAPRRAPG